jgi:NAD(P)-dependent dehydrogenase (short-subunit alcohol dehydrogenase family)
MKNFHHFDKLANRIIFSKIKNMSQVAVVVGGSRGIGLSLVQQLAKADYTVHVGVRNIEKSTLLLDVQKDFPKSVQLFQIDLSSEAAVVKGTQELSKKVEKIDLLINNGATWKNDWTLEKVTEEGLLDDYKTNALGPFFVIRELLPLIQKSESAKVVNITSGMGSIGIAPNFGVMWGYNASKAALNMISKCFTTVLKTTPIIVIHPGLVGTDGYKSTGLTLPTITPDESAKGILDVVYKLKAEDSGKFFTNTGETLPW